MRAHGRYARLAAVIGLIGLLLPAARAWAADPDALADRIRGLLTPQRVGKIRVGVYIERVAPRPQVIFEQMAHEQFKPASNQKILTSAAAMTMLPADFAYRTILARRGDDLIIIGSGDPSTGDPRMCRAEKKPITHVFHAWAEALTARGITKIAGDLIFDDYVFEQQHLHPDWDRQFDLQQWYCAPTGGLNFNDNCVDVVIRPASQPGETPDVQLVPASMYMHLQNTSRTASKGEPTIRRSTSDPTTILVSGPVSKGNDGFSISVPDPGMLFASACRTSLAAKGIEILGQTRRGRIRAADLSIPRDLEIIAVDERRMSEVMWRVNKSSLNMFAEALLKTLGAYDSSGRLVAVGSYENGRAALQRFLDRLGIDRESYVIDDGSGLSHNNRVTPAMIATILRFMNAHPRRTEWWSSLAVPGESVGTLRNRMKPLAGKIFAKTGSIRGVSALSGYAKASEDEIYIFSILCNETGSSSDAARRLQDEICRLLAGGTEASKPR